MVLLSIEMLWRASHDGGQAMKLHRRDFPLFLTLAGAVSTTALGQAGSPAGAPGGSATQSVASVPDFSGVGVHPYFPGVEPPASGPGPVLNKSRRRNGLGNSSQFVGDYANPILKPEAAEVVKRLGEISLSGVTYPTPSNRCWPSGVPYIFFQPGMQMLQQLQRIVFLYLRDHEVRQVRLNQPHPAQVTPSWYGDSVGHYEGDTLVIDTIGVKTDRPFAMVDMFGAPYSAALHVVERYRLVDYEEAQAAVARNIKENIRTTDTASDLTDRGKRLQLVFTMEDEGVFTMPWSATITYERPAQEWMEIACAENIFDFYAGQNEALVPTANRPDF
jgi:hypothetical protein